jgi:hypothetical protein
MFAPIDVPPPADHSAVAVEPRMIDTEFSARIGDPPMSTSGRDLPPHLVGDRSKRRAPADPISQRIAKLLCEHPEVGADYPHVNLVTMTPQARRYMLASINRRLKEAIEA